MSDDLWGYDLDDDAAFPDSDDNTATGSARKRKGGNDGAYGAEALLPAEKRQRVRRMHRHGSAMESLDGSPPEGLRNGKDTARAGDSDSDLDLIEQAEQRQARHDVALGGPAADARAGARTFVDSKSRSLLDNCKAKLQSLHHGQRCLGDGDADDDGDDAGLCEAPSPLEFRGEAAAAAAAAEPSTQPQSGHGDGRSVEKGPRIVLKLETSKGHSLQVRLRSTDKLAKVFACFRETAVNEGWIAAAAAELRFEFDGEVLQPSDTPAKHDMEDEDKIEVHIPTTAAGASL